MKDWKVFKLNTQNGVRIGISQEDEQGVILESNLSEQEALEKCEEWAKKLNVKVFDNNDDVAI